jgi:type VI protein secretion system component Hcp
MATDAYIAFDEGLGKEKSPYGLPMPRIEGDSTDAFHYWWCELRSCNFDLKAEDWKTEVEGTDAEENENKKDAKAKFEKVTLTKRVDWASAHLFYLCCYQAMALSDATKTEKEKKDTLLTVVTVEICRQTGATVDLNGHKVAEKIPYVTVRYKDVRIVNYSVDMSDVEAIETITFEFSELDFEHIRTSPETGLKVEKDAVTKALGMANSAAGAAGSGSTTGGETGGSAGASPAPVVVAPNSGSASTGNSGGAAVPAGGGSAVDAAANANFPGLWPGTGFGILPD